ncbi:MAG: xylulokinase [Candidatus Limnocylindrales bacterium]
MAVDLGTSAIKVALLDDRLNVVARSTISQVVVSDRSGRREHRVAVMLARTRTAMRRVLATGPHELQAISVSGPRGSFAIADERGGARTGIITWQDTRAAADAASDAVAAGPAYAAITGTGFDPSVVLPKLVWLRRERPELSAGDWRLVTPQAIILAEFGASSFIVDTTVAAHTGLLDVRRRAWSPELMDAYDVPVRVLPSLVDPGAVVGYSSERARERWGIPAGTPLVAAGSDGVCSELGAGVVDLRQVYAYLGTASAIAGPVAIDAPRPDESLILMPGSGPDRLRLLGLGKAGGSAADWWRRVIGVRGFARFERLVESSDPGAGGVNFLPTLAGATAPVPDSRARGAFVGLALASSREDLARAVLEGVAVELRWLCAAMHLHPAPAEIRLTGGAARSNAWSQILADVFQVPIARVNDPDPGLRGAGAYAWAGVTRVSAAALARAREPGYDRFEPRRQFEDVYVDLADRYGAARRAFERAGLDERLNRPAGSPQVLM